jgi:histone-lysine N-methyltransferase SETMAR
VKHLWWVPHKPDDVTNMAPVATAESLLKNVRQALHLGWWPFLTSDDSWFVCVTDYRRMQLPEGLPPQSRPSTIVSTPKVMVSIFWSPLDFLVMTTLPPRTKFTSAHFCGGSIPTIVAGIPFDLAKSFRQMILLMDDATARRARESITCLKRFRPCPIDQPPYSPDLASSDFYLSEKLKGALVVQEFESTEELLLAIMRVTDSIGRAGL